MDDFQSRLQEFLDLLRRAYDEQLPILILKSGQQAGVYMETIFAEYPPSPDGRPLRPFYYRERIKDGDPTGEWYFSKFVSDKQQGWFFKNLAEGTLELPYVRTGLLGRSFTSAANILNGHLIIEVGTAVEGAEYVIGELQSWYHFETGWVNVPEELLERQEEFIVYFLDRFFAAYEDYLINGTMS